MSSSIEPIAQLSSLPVRWRRLAHPYSLWARQLAWWCLVLALWQGVLSEGSGVGWLLLSGSCVLYALYGAPVYDGSWSAWSAQIIAGEYFLSLSLVRDWPPGFQTSWWVSKLLEVCALGVMGYSLYRGVPLGLLAAALWWQAVRWWQRDQLACLGRRFVQGGNW